MLVSPSDDQYREISEGFVLRLRRGFRKIVSKSAPKAPKNAQKVHKKYVGGALKMRHRRCIKVRGWCLKNAPKTPGGRAY